MFTHSSSSTTFVFIFLHTSTEPLGSLLPSYLFMYVCIILVVLYYIIYRRRPILLLFLVTLPCLAWQQAEEANTLTTSFREKKNTFFLKVILIFIATRRRGQPLKSSSSSAVPFPRQLFVCTHSSSDRFLLGSTWVIYWWCSSIICRCISVRKFIRSILYGVVCIISCSTYDGQEQTRTRRNETHPPRRDREMIHYTTNATKYKTKQE